MVFQQDMPEHVGFELSLSNNVVNWLSFFSVRELRQILYTVFNSCTVSIYICGQQYSQWVTVGVHIYFSVLMRQVILVDAGAINRVRIAGCHATILTACN